MGVSDLLVETLRGLPPANPLPPAGLTHRPGLWAFSSGAQGGQAGWRQGGDPRSRVVGCSGASEGHCLGLGAALLLPEGEPGPEKGRGSGPGSGEQGREHQGTSTSRCSRPPSPHWNVLPPRPHQEKGFSHNTWSHNVCLSRTSVITQDTEKELGSTAQPREAACCRAASGRRSESRGWARVGTQQVLMDRGF